MDWRPHIGTYLVQSCPGELIEKKDGRRTARKTMRNLETLMGFFGDVPLRWALPTDDEARDAVMQEFNGLKQNPSEEDIEEATAHYQKLMFESLEGRRDSIFLAASSYLSEMNMFLGENMTEEQRDSISYIDGATLLVQWAGEMENGEKVPPPLDTYFRPETDDFHTVWGPCYWPEEGTKKRHEVKNGMLGIFFNKRRHSTFGPVYSYLEVSYCKILPS